ncbi:hypothetical protein BC938DRAFT_477469, partial [Jimgerdemannia flammicorona]
MEPERKEGVAHPFGFPLRSYPVTVDTMFASEVGWFKVVGKEDLIGMNIQFVRNIFKQIRQVVRDDFLSLYHLAFEASTNYKSGQKLAKQMLKTDRMNLMLWNGYAQMEKANGKYSEARKVYITALSTYRSFPEHQRADAPLLYRMFAEMEFELGRKGAALTILAAMAEEAGKVDVPDENDLQVPPPTKLLKARKFFAQKTSNLSTLAISETQYRSAHHIYACHALFEYLSQGLDEACRVFDRVFDEYVTRGVERSIDAEILFMTYAKLVYRHSVSGYAFRPGVLKGVLDRALNLFPNNTLFLSLFFYNEARTKIENRVRRFLNGALEKEPSHLLWTFALYAELHHHLPYNVHLVRSLFDRALECHRSRCSVALWKLYIQFEIIQNNLGKAKTLFFRAIRECPWAKELYLLAFRNIQHELSAKEQDEVFSLILEKELRIRTPVEEFLVGRKEEEEEEEEEEDEETKRLRDSDEEDERKRYP